MTIKESDYSDRESTQCAEVLVSALQVMEMPFRDTVLQSASRITIFEPRGRRRFIALKDGYIVGFLDVQGNEVSFLMVKLEEQRTGIGTELMRHAMALLANEVQLLCIKQNRAALQFYFAIGFEVNGSRDGRFFGVPMNNFVLSMPKRQ